MDKSLIARTAATVRIAAQLHSIVDSRFSRAAVPDSNSIAQILYILRTKLDNSTIRSNDA